MLAAEPRTKASVLFTGDGDFVPVVEALKRLGQIVIVGGFKGSTSSEVIIAADDYVDLSEHVLSAWRAVATTDLDQPEVEPAPSDTQGT